MKKFILGFFLLISSLFLHAQTSASCGVKSGPVIKPSTVTIVLYSNDPETVWNAFRLASFSAGKKDLVTVFLLGKGVEASELKSNEFDVQGMMKAFVANGGKILACGTCLASRNKEGIPLCPESTLSDLYTLIKTSNLVLTF